MTLGPNPYPFDPAIIDYGLRPPTMKERLAGMKITMPLDREDRRALAQLGGYALLALGAVAAWLLLAVTLALCVRIFIVVSGLGVG